MTSLRAEAVHFAYGDVPVLHDVSLAVDAGEVVGVVGPNGSGKSTIVRLLAGLAAPSAGRVLLDGAPLSSLRRRDVARRLAVLPQDPVVGFPFSALEVVLLGRAPHLRGLAFPGPADRAVAEREMAALEVTQLAGRRIDALSGGERQRVLLARALAQEPDVLLLDEPTTHLDLRHQVGMCAHVRRLARARGLAVVAVLHDLNLAARYCDRLVVLSRGRVAADGPPAAVLDAARLEAVFGTPLDVSRHAATGVPVVLPSPAD